MPNAITIPHTPKIRAMKIENNTNRTQHLKNGEEAQPSGQRATNKPHNRCTESQEKSIVNKELNFA
jgi:hypothetical protein